jgi:hypothetical protein
MAVWLTKALRRIQKHLENGELRLTDKARGEARELQLYEADVVDVIAGLTADDSAGRKVDGRTGEWAYIFKPEVADRVLYVKLALRNHCIVFSFHVDED